MTAPAYPAARAVAETVREHFARLSETARRKGRQGLAPEPDAPAVEAVIDAAFWASLRREEGYSPKISLAFLPPEQAGRPLTFGRRLPLTPTALSRLAPAVERHGIHLGVWRDAGELYVWGTTRDRKSTRLNSSHDQISYAVFCLKKKKTRPSSISKTQTCL